MWLLFWILFMLLLFALPLGYGWSRGWGFPYPSYYYRRRMLRRPAYERIHDEGDVRSDWGVLADILWIALIIGFAWLIFAAFV